MSHDLDRGDLVTVYFDLDDQDWHGRPNEGLWAEPCGDLKPPTMFKTLNSPFFVLGISYGDFVNAAPREGGVGLQFAGVVDRGGCSTFMLLVHETRLDFEDHWKPIQEMGCGYESMCIKLKPGKYVLYSITVPPEVDIRAVDRLFMRGADNGIWMVHHGHIEHSM